MIAFLKLNEDGFCQLCRRYTDFKDIYFAEDQHCTVYYICGLCKENLEDAGKIDQDGYLILDSV